MIPSPTVDELNRRRELRDAVWLATIPLGAAVVLGVLLLPRRATPEAVPLPQADVHQLAATRAADHELAEQARRAPLPGAVRALGSAVREFHGLEAQASDEPGVAPRLYDAKHAVDQALIDALAGSNDARGLEPLRELRAVQLETFLDEIARFEQSGEQSPELRAVAGGFVRSMTVEGWCDGRTLAPHDDALRAMFKQMWNAFLGLEARPELALTLDEQRALYAFYIGHAHAPKTTRDALASARRGARDDAACKAIDEADRAATEGWRLERIRRVAAIDPAYPADYARGVASWRRGDYGASAQAFRAWLRAHPDGPLALRAQNYLRAAAATERVE
jgi:hypothetical protein